MPDTEDSNAQLGLNINFLNLLDVLQLEKSLPYHEIEQYKIYCGTCPNKNCLAPLHYESQENFVECFKCLNTHSTTSLFNTYETDLKRKPPHQIPKSTIDFVKVNGQSNCSCKLLSPLLTKYGMDKAGKAVLLKDIGHAETINCGKTLDNRAFKISPDHINIKGYGTDISGSSNYLEEFFDRLEKFHNGEKRLVAIHADGDGNCLLHALSRALIGVELFSHSLRTNLQDHLKDHRFKYLELLRNFFDEYQWDEIIDEADPNCGTKGKKIPFLGNPHIFALSNILRRPIILFDSPQKLQNSADYAGLFVPALLEPSKCSIRSPLCIAWSGDAHNHFVALVAVHGTPLPTIPADLIPQPWAVGQETAQRYLSFNEDGSLPVCDGKPLGVRYLQKLTNAMREVFIDRHHVALSLVEDFRRYCLESFHLVELTSEDIMASTAQAVAERRLFRCLECEVLVRVNDHPQMELISDVSVVPGELQANLNIMFSNQNKTPWEETNQRLVGSSCRCSWCGTENIRLVDRFGNICYKNGDQIETLNGLSGKKFYWDGKEYDNKPLQFTLSLNRNRKVFEIPIVWFHGDSNPRFNSDCTAEAARAVKDCFPEENETDVLTEEISEMIKKKCITLGVLKSEKSTYKSTAKKSRNSSNKHKETPGESSADLKGRLKRKEPTMDHVQSPVTNPLSSKSNFATASLNTCPQQASSHITVKICNEEGLTKTLKLDPNVDFCGFQKEIDREFGIKPAHQILKVGFPPKQLVSPPCGGPLGLQSNQQIRVRVRKTTKKIPQDLRVEKNKMIPVADNTNVLAELDKSSEAVRLLESLSQKGLSANWKYVMDKPELFYPGGYFYKKFKTAVGLNPGQHCCLSLLPGLELYYNHLFDRIEICLEPKGHFPVDDETKCLIESYFHLQETNSIVHSDSIFSHRHEPAQLLEHA